jgi:EAL domain-containing protein (putative c-di-GMP-specific phosphodiesterase class I)
MTADDDDAIIVRATIEMAHNLGLQVVAEGVENKATLDYLKSMNCDIAQGYYFSKPMTADKFMEWLTTKLMAS